MTPLISIIVPVYKVEKYVAQCIESLINQKHKNIEIIIVDDGSNDESGIICDDFSKTDSRIRVIHKENGGVSSARNVGLSEAKGDYISFVDGDDFVSTDYISDMLKVALETSADIVTCNYYNVWNDGKKKELLPLKIPTGEYIVKTGKESLSDMLYGKTCYASSCCKLYKKHIFNDITFPPLRMGEDSFTVYQCLLKSNKVAHLRKPNYCYLQHSESVMHSDNFYKFYDYILLSDDFMKIVNDKHKDLFLPAANRLIENNFWVYMKMKNDRKKYKTQLEHIVSNIKQYRKYCLFDHNVCLRTRVACLLSYFGMNILDGLYKIVG